MIINVLVFLPPLLALTVAILAIHFNRSPVFFYLLLVVLANVLLGMGWLPTPLAYSLVALFIPLWLLMLSILPERGIFSLRALPAYLALLLGGGVILLIANLAPPWALQLVLADWLPARYFDWTRLPQSVWLVASMVFIYLLVLNFVRPATHRAAALGIFLLLMLQFHYADISSSLTVFSSGALLICLYGIVQESWRMAYLDELTELPARRALRERFQKISGLYSVAMLDVDHFKKFNDSYGHDTGDGVLRMIAARINRVSGGGLAYRYGGEEFTLVFPGKKIDDVLAHLDAVRETIAASPFVINREDRRKGDRGKGRQRAKSVQVTVSIGVADSSPGRLAPWDVMKQADKALYRAKKQGRNRVCS
jgi:diguanylate cyclase (GGDEF)-like protein